MSRLYHPAPVIDVNTNDRGLPVALSWRGTLYRGEVRQHWRIRTGWWGGEEIWRDYYLYEADELVCEVYHDRRKGDWRLHRIYD